MGIVLAEFRKLLWTALSCGTQAQIPVTRADRVIITGGASQLKSRRLQNLNDAVISPTRGPQRINVLEEAIHGQRRGEAPPS